MPERINTERRKPYSARSSRMGVIFLLIVTTSIAVSAAAMSRSCAPGNLNTGDLAALIYEFQLSHCATTEVMVRSGRVGPALFLAANAWLQKLLEDIAFSHLSQSTVGTTRSGALAQASANNVRYRRANSRIVSVCPDLGFSRYKRQRGTYHNGGHGETKKPR